MKKKIALVTGGFSGESVISYKSAENVLEHLDKDLFEVHVIDITQNGWFYTDEKGAKQSVAKSDFSIVFNDEKVIFNKALMCIHGTPGEDGKLLGYFDMIGLPYTSCSAAVSALTFNKRNTVAVASMAGVQVARSIIAFLDDDISSKIQQVEQLNFPIIVKPNNGGSSIGMSKVSKKDTGEIQKAIEMAFEQDQQVLIEEFIYGREFTIGVFKDQTAKIATLPMTEIILKTGRELFDFEAKYNGETAEVTPAETTKEIADSVALEAKKVYKALNCDGVVRIDFIYNEMTNTPFLLEVNTVPGQTKESLVPKQVSAMGWSLKEFYTHLIAAE